MKHTVWYPAVLAAAVTLSTSVAAAAGSLLSSPAPPSDIYLKLNTVFTGDWQRYGRLFTDYQGSGLFTSIFLLILTVLPALFLIHAIIIGPKRFDHDGEQILFFSPVTRFIHWLAALSFSLVVLTGLVIVFGKVFGGGAPGMTARVVHLAMAPVFAACALLLFLIWLKDMLPMPHDLGWLLIMGGYLSKGEKPVPASKFNLGQKVWFWLATAGGGVMGYSGYHLYLLRGPVDQLRQMALIHNFLGMALAAMYLVHLYMSLFAVSGALTSMITGRKPRREVEILHSRYPLPDRQG